MTKCSERVVRGGGGHCKRHGGKNKNERVTSSEKVAISLDGDLISRSAAAGGAWGSVGCKIRGDVGW